MDGAIPPQIGNLSQLIHLDLHSNKLSSAMPENLGSLTNLDVLYLFDNRLSGSIPPTIGNLANIKTLSLDNNLLNGPIPSEVGKLGKLNVFGVSNNQMIGVLPSELGNLIELQQFFIDNNQFSGALPTGFVNLTKLASFSFNNTDLCEPPDTNFQAWLSGIPNLSRTNIVCAIPTDEFREDFSTDPDTNGRWRIFRQANDSGVWDSNSEAFYLTRDVLWQSSIIFANYTLTSRTWNASFRFKAGGQSNGVCGDRGGDGLTFFFYGKSFTPGSGRIYPPEQSYGIRLDNWTGRSCEVVPGELINYIAVTRGYDILYAVQDDRVEDNQWHTMNISFDNRKIVVGVDGSTVIDYQIENPDYTFSSVGFNAFTGGASDDHIIDDFTLSSIVTPTYSISGRVIDSAGDCQQGVTITTNTGNNTLTDSNGNYTISDLAPGTYILTATKSSCIFFIPSPVIVPPDATGVDFLCSSPNTNLNVCQLQKGDILLVKGNFKLGPQILRMVVGTYWYHTAIYIGDGYIAEATGPEPIPEADQVKTNMIYETPWWTGDGLNDWIVIRPRTTAIIKTQAADFAKERAEHTNPDILYNNSFSFINKDTDDAFYCSQLPWRAYKRQNQGPDLEVNKGILTEIFAPVVTPDDLYYSVAEDMADVVQEDESVSNDFERWIFGIFSPADMLLVDPLGRRAGYDSVTQQIINEIPNADYIGPDTEVEAISVAIPNTNNGDWKLVVTGTDNGTYTLKSEVLDVGEPVTQTRTLETSPGHVDIFKIIDPSFHPNELLTQVFLVYLPIIEH